MHTVRDLLAAQSNDYRDHVASFTARTGLAWHAPTPPHMRPVSTVSVVIPARDAAATITAVLDAFTRQVTSARFDVVVVDDASGDDTARLAASHRLGPTVVRLPAHHGAGQARNAGVAAARGQTVLFCDADMVPPPHTVQDVATRAGNKVVLLGFRHNIPHAVHAGGTRVPSGAAELTADHRVRWHGRPGRQIHTGVHLDREVDLRPLDDTCDLLELGHGRTCGDWDLPRMVVSCLLAVPRRAVVDVGGFHPGFRGWGEEDTHLGALLVAAGCLVVPLRQVVGFHLDPPDPDGAWQRKLADWPANAALYRSLLDQPPPYDGAASFTGRVAAVLTEPEEVFR